MKIVLLTKYGNLAASTRQRFNQYTPFLEDCGFEIIHQPLLSNRYINNLNSNKNQKLGYLTACYLKRLKWIFSRPDIDLVWLHCELFPFLPGFMEKLVSLISKPVVLDFDDAIFHNYDMHSQWVIRTFLGKKLHATIGSADLIFCGNRYLEEYALQISSKTQIVPTIVDSSIYYPGKNKLSKDYSLSNLKVGWIGTPDTYNRYLLKFLPSLISNVESNGGRIVLMGAESKATKHNLVDYFKWSEIDEVPFIQNLDIGIMPLTDTPFARGKCGYKLIQYMACGIPVVASPVGVNCEIVDHGVNGFLANTNEEWSLAINTLLSDKDLRYRMGKAGRKKVLEHYSLDYWGSKVAKTLYSIANKK